MKRLVLALCLSLWGTLSLFAEFRIDTGLDLLLIQAPERNRDDSVLLNGFFLPLPEFGLYGQFNFGDFHAGAGLRGFSYIFYSALWPVVYGEYDLGQFTFHAQIGGGLHGTLDLLGGMDAVSGVESTNSSNAVLRLSSTIIPEVSVWYRFGKFFRVGAGWITLFMLNPADRRMFDVSPQFYMSLKMSFPSAAARRNPDGTQRIF
jgi:hypothetical protein